jgi:hypothetical protein
MLTGHVRIVWPDRPPHLPERRAGARPSRPHAALVRCRERAGVQPARGVCESVRIVRALARVPAHGSLPQRAV